MWANSVPMLASYDVEHDMASKKNGRTPTPNLCRIRLQLFRRGKRGRKREFFVPEWVNAHKRYICIWFFVPLLGKISRDENRAHIHAHEHTKHDWGTNIMEEWKLTTSFSSFLLLGARLSSEKLLVMYSELVSGTSLETWWDPFSPLRVSETVFHIFVSLPSLWKPFFTWELKYVKNLENLFKLQTWLIQNLRFVDHLNTSLVMRKLNHAPKQTKASSVTSLIWQRKWSWPRDRARILKFEIPNSKSESDRGQAAGLSSLGCYAGNHAIEPLRARNGRPT